MSSKMRVDDQKKQIRIQKKQNLRIKKKTNKDQKQNKIVDFIVKLVERRQVRGSKKTKSDSKLMKTYGNLEDQKINKTGIKKKQNLRIKKKQIRIKNKTKRG